MLAAARQAATTGRFVQALELYARAAELPGSARAAEICRQERAVLAGWVDPSAPPPAGWSGRMLASFRSQPLRYTVLGPGVDIVGRHVGHKLTAGVAAMLAGHMGTAARWLSAAVDDPDNYPAVVATGRVTLAVVTALGTPLAERRELALTDDLPELIEAVDAPWVTALTRGVRGLSGTEQGLREAHEIADELDRHGDAWGSAATRFMAALGEVLAGGTPLAALDDLSRRLKVFDARVIECWCQAWRSTVLARLALDGTPESRLAACAEAAAVVELATELGVPGAQVWGLTVQAQLADVDGDTERAAALTAEATDLRRLGIDVVVPPLRAGATTSARPAAAATARATGAPPVESPEEQQDREERAAFFDGLGEKARAERDAVTVRCFGGLVLEVNGESVDVASAKPRVRTALRVLAAHAGQPVHIETLVDALWPSGGPADGKRSLQVAVSSLRRLLDDHGARVPLVVREGDAYLLALPPGSEADVVEFAAERDECRSAARSAESEVVIEAGQEALTVHGRGLLPEEGPAEWVVPLRRAFAQEATELAALVAEHAIVLERWEVAVAACRHGLHIDRYSDALWRLLVTAHERQGDPAAAAQAQERYQLVLRDLGVSEL
jgi:DNA-binding SARP family transcriptional activator